MLTLDKIKEFRLREIEHLKHKLEEEDWHGVQDAASDIREWEAMIEVFDSRKQLIVPVGTKIEPYYAPL